MTYRIKDWSKFQHFKDRNPPWVKLYRDILDDPDWHELDGESAKILTMLWLIASEDETHTGTLPDDRKLSFRLRIKESQLKQTLNKLSHWLIQDDISLISEQYQNDAPETEKRRDRVESPEGVSDSIFKDYLEVRKSKKAKWTETALHGLQRESMKAGITLQDAMRICVERNWTSLKAEWLKDQKQNDSFRGVIL